MRTHAERHETRCPEPPGAGRAIVPEMETWDALRARRNVRTSEDLAIPSGDLERVSSAGARTVVGVARAGDRAERDTLQYDIGQVTMSIMLAAADLGIGSGHASVGDQDLARGILGLPQERQCA